MAATSQEMPWLLVTIGALWVQAGTAPESLGGAQPCGTLVSDFWSPDGERVSAGCFKNPVVIFFDDLQK
jgi:hypothetical protein